MQIQKYLLKHYKLLTNKNIAITGATGGIGSTFCKNIAYLNGNLILIGRNIDKLNNLKEELLSINKNIKIDILICNFLDLQSVKDLINSLKNIKIDFLIHNAGAYCLPNKNTKDGYNNVYQINNIVPYFISYELINELKLNNTKVIYVSSITARMKKIDKNNYQSTTSKPMALYGNSKRWGLLSLSLLFDENNIKYSIVHPGVSYTNITSNYKNFIHKLIKYPMKLLFISNKKASLNLLTGMFIDVKYPYWIGPRIFNIWGKPKKSLAKVKDNDEFINIKMQEIMNEISKN